MSNKSKKKRTFRGEDADFREEILTGPMNEKDEENVKAMHEVNNMLMALNPTVPLPYQVIYTLSANAADYLHMEYVARQTDAEEKNTGDDKLSFMTDEDMKVLESALEIISLLMLKATTWLAEQSMGENTPKGPTPKGPMQA